MTKFNSVQVQVFSNWNTSIRYSSMDIETWVEKDAELNLINSDMHRIDIQSDELVWYTWDDTHDGGEVFDWYSIYYLSYEDFISQNWTFIFEWERL